MHFIETAGTQSGYEALSPTTSTGFTSTVIKPTSGAFIGQTAKVVWIHVETNPIRVRFDGTAPTAVNGMLVAVGTYWKIVGADNIVNFHCIDTAAGASSVKCLFFF